MGVFYGESGAHPARQSGHHSTQRRRAEHDEPLVLLGFLPLPEKQEEEDEEEDGAVSHPAAVAAEAAAVARSRSRSPCAMKQRGK